MPTEKITEKFPRHFLKLFKELNATNDILTFMIRGHLHCESVLTELIYTAVLRPNALEQCHLNFSTKLNLCNALGLIPESLVPGLAGLGKLRNRLAHRLEYSISEQDQADLINTIRSTGEPYAAEYLSKGTEFPKGLRLCIIGLFMDLYFNLADTNEEEHDMAVNLAVLSIKEYGFDSDEFIDELKKKVQ
ncbi:MAG: hypothetical protein P9X24_05055 [Candidatus Hatepunaea meridiana]|nr:hypothetical protein [Candidatus Hatepunaea meridiana]